jgi:uncharacterized protein (TIGR03086 family)
MSTNTTSSPHGWPLLDTAHTALRAAVHGVASTDWQQPTPCEAWTVAQVFQHAAGDQQGYAGVLTGSGFPSYDPFAPSGVLDGDPDAFLETALAASHAAFAGVAADDPTVPVPLPQGPLPAWLAVGACALDAAVHAWDIAVATGQPSPLDEELSTDLMRVAREIVEPLRGFAYAAPLDPARDADPAVPSAADQLLRYLGRDPRWSAA